MIIDRLIDKIVEYNNPTVVGLDPRIEYIPTHILEENYEKYGKNLKGVSNAFLDFNKVIIDNIYDIVPSVKPQIAMYEKYGIDGLIAFEETVKYAKSKGLYVISDIKRGDIGSTAKDYADAHIGFAEIEGKKFETFNSDFVTLNPYLGYDSVEPFLDVMSEYNKGAFILVKTSNKGSKDLQDLIVDGEKLYMRVGKMVESWGANFRGKYGYSSVGAVVGGTHRDEMVEVRKNCPNLFFLIPGYGAQGGKAEDIRACFDKDGLGGIVNSSRGIIAAFKLEKYQSFGEKNFGDASRQAAIDMKNDLLG